MCHEKKTQIQEILTFYFMSIGKYKLLYLGFLWYINLLSRAQIKTFVIKKKF